LFVEPVFQVRDEVRRITSRENLSLLLDEGLVFGPLLTRLNPQVLVLEDLIFRVFIFAFIVALAASDFIFLLFASTFGTFLVTVAFGFLVNKLFTAGELGANLMLVGDGTSLDPGMLKNLIDSQSLRRIESGHPLKEVPELL